MHHTMKRALALLLAASFTAAQIPCGGMAKAKLSTKRLSIVFLIIILTTTIYLWLISLKASKELSILLLKLLECR